MFDGKINMEESVATLHSIHTQALNSHETFNK